MSEKVKIAFEGETVDAEELTFQKVAERVGEYSLGDGARIELRHNVTSIFRLCDKKKPDNSPIYVLTGNAVLTTMASRNTETEVEA